MSRTVCALFALCIFVPAAPAPAADSVTIAQAIDEALQHNLSLLAERSTLTIADAQMIAAKLRPNPVFSFSADHLDWLGTGYNAENNGGPPEIAWRLDVPLERGGKREARMALASVVKSAADAQFADAVRALRQDVTLACIDTVNHALALRALERSQRDLRFARALFLSDRIPDGTPVPAGIDDVLSYLHYPQPHRVRISSTNPLERLNLEIRRRTRVIGIFPHAGACLRLIGMLLVERHEDWLTDDKAYLTFDDLSGEEPAAKVVTMAANQ